MEIDSLLQLTLSLQAALLGWGLGLLYDLLQTVRRQCRGFLAVALDVLYGLAVPAALFFFALRVTGGELRIYHLLCFAGGLILFLVFCSAPLRPIWDFWADALLRFGRFCLLPLRFLRHLVKKIAFYLKKLFHFQKKYYIIIRRKRRSPPGKQRRKPYGKRRSFRA